MDLEPPEEDLFDNGEGPSGTSAFFWMGRSNSVLTYKTSSSDDRPITSIAQSARVIRGISSLGNNEGSADTPTARMKMVGSSFDDNHTDSSASDEQVMVPSPFDGQSNVPFQETTMDKGKGKAPMACFGTFLDRVATATKYKGQGNEVEMVDSVIEAIGTLAVDQKKPPAATRRQRVDWSRLTNSEFVTRRGSESSISRSQISEVQTPLTVPDSMPSPDTAKSQCLCYPGHWQAILESRLTARGIKPYEIKDSKYGKGMFATRDIAKFEIIVEEDFLIRLLCLDVHASETEGEAQYQQKIEALRYQFDQLEATQPGDRYFIDGLETFDGEEPFIERVMRKFAFESHHPDYFHCSALYRDICRVNHCCDKPNASLRNHNAENDWSTGTLASIQPIAKGDEILIDYTAVEGKRLDKMEVFQKYGFICTCSACKFAS